MVPLYSSTTGEKTEWIKKKTWMMKREQKDQDQDQFPVGRRLDGLHVAPAPAQNKSLIRPAGSVFSIRVADSSTQQTNIRLVLSLSYQHTAGPLMVTSRFLKEQMFGNGKCHGKITSSCCTLRSAGQDLGG